MEENKSFITPTVEWMKESYDRLNELYFDGQLGQCDFGLFHDWKVYGYFQTNALIKANKKTRKTYRMVGGKKLYLSKDNFYDLANPAIKLNSLYMASADDWTSVFLHEMCHYYVYMHGVKTKMMHGKEFNKIARIISERSNYKIGTYSYITIKVGNDFYKSKIGRKMLRSKIVISDCGDNIQFFMSSDNKIIDGFKKKREELGQKVIVSDNFKL